MDLLKKFKSIILMKYYFSNVSMVYVKVRPLTRALDQYLGGDMIQNRNQTQRLTDQAMILFNGTCFYCYMFVFLLNVWKLKLYVEITLIYSLYLYLEQEKQQNW